jgi:hypothetical protein
MDDPIGDGVGLGCLIIILIAVGYLAWCFGQFILAAAHYLQSLS